MSYDTIDAQVEELSTYAVNFSGPHYNDLGEKLSKAWVSGEWDQRHVLSVIRFELLDPAATDYKAEFGSMTQSLDDMWPTGIRWAAACRVYDHFAEEFKLGNFYS